MESIEDQHSKFVRGIGSPEVMVEHSTLWAGFPLARLRSEPYGTGQSYELKTYGLSFVVRGGCSATVKAGAKAKRLEFAPGSFAGYPTGIHWDWLTFCGSVESININLDWNTLGDEVALAEPDRPSLGATYACERDVVLGEIARAMQNEIQAGCPTGRIYAESLSIALSARLASFQRPTGRRSGRYSQLSPRKAANLIELIDASLDQSLSIVALARQFGLSASHFAGCFLETFGCSVHKYVVSRRVLKAIELLENRDLEACDIALQCGFSSQSHFSSVIKKTTGQTPSKYRKQSVEN